MGKATLIAVFLCLLFRADAATWYAAGDGSETNGTFDHPWGVRLALANTNNSFVAAGDTIEFKDGFFRTTDSNTVYSSTNIIDVRLRGTSGSKITIKPVNPFGFTWDGGLLLTEGSNVIVREFRFVCSNSVNRASITNNENPPGITVFTEGNDILHNLFENNGHPAIASWNTTRGKNIRGNIIRFAGYDDWSPAYMGANRGSGMYLQNATNSNIAFIGGNISYCNYTTGMKAYGNADIWGFTFLNNILVENNEAGIFYHQDNYGSSNLVMATNWSWNGGPAFYAGYPLGNGGHSNAVLVSNYGVDENLAGSTAPINIVDGWRNITATNNTIVNLSTRYVFYLEVTGETNGDSASHHFDYNSYYSTNTGGVGGEPFFSKDIPYSLVNWRTNVFGESNSTHSYVLPTNVSVYACRPSEDTNYVHVAVFNWALDATATVDLSSYFPAGHFLTVYDAQDIPNAYTNFIFSGTTATLELTRTNRATMLGTFTQRSQWEGFDPRFRAFVIVRSTPFGDLSFTRGSPRLRGIRMKL